MQYSVNIRMNSVGLTKALMASEGGLDLNTAFSRANELLEQNKDCFAEIVEANSYDVVATIH